MRVSPRFIRIVIMAGPVVPRRGKPDTWYPAGDAEASARWITLADGERVRIVEYQIDASHSGPHALLLHGWGCNTFHFRRLGPALSRRGIRATAIDLRGHGLTHKPASAAEYAARAATTFVLRVMDALDLSRAGLVGHSLGGAIALDAAATAADRTQWLTLLNPVGLSRLSYAPLFRLVPAGIAELIPGAVSRAVGYAALHLAYGHLARPERGDLQQYLFPTLMPGGRRGMLSYAGAFTWEPRPAHELERISAPTHVLLGERDRVVKPREAAERAQYIPRVRIEVMAQAGHVLAEEAPEHVADVIEAQVNALRAPNDALRARGGTR
jgi:pimeloyl-ACP methyl ester carboxylesterase